MKGRPELDAAYRRGFELSQREHALPSTQTAIAQGPHPDFLQEATGGRARNFMGPPEEIVDEYADRDEAMAFMSGWVAGAGVGLPENGDNGGGGTIQ